MCFTADSGIEILEFVKKRERVREREKRERVREREKSIRLNDCTI